MSPSWILYSLTCHFQGPNSFNYSDLVLPNHACILFCLTYQEVAARG